MQHEVQNSRAKFISRLSILAAGAVVLSSVTGVLTGCGGGGGSGISSPTPVPSTSPTLPDLAPITPQTPAQAAATFQTQFGVQTTVGAAAGPPVTDPQQSLQGLITLANLVLPTYTIGPDGAATGVTLQSAGSVSPSLNATDLNSIIKILATAREYVQFPGSRTLTRVPVIRRGDVPIFVTFTQFGKTFKTIGFRHTNGTLGFDFVLSAQPGKSEVRTVPANQDQNDRLNNNGSTVETVTTNRNPYDGHAHYEFVLSAKAAFDRLTGDATVSNPAATVEILGPFVRATPSTIPTIVVAASSFSLQVRAAGEQGDDVESDDTFTYDYSSHEVWKEQEKD